MKQREIFVKSTEIHVSTTPVTLQTVVGSCVAVCLYDHEKKIGGMNHFLLPRNRPGHPDGPMGKFGNIAVPELLRRLESFGANRSNVVAKIAGGASILSISSHNHIPMENVKATKEALAELGIPIVGQDVGGSKGRKVVFDTGTGHVTINGEKLM